MAGRERLGSRSGFGYRESVYRTRDCFEVDDVEGYEVTRKRVFYDDVVLVTRHRFVPWGPTVLCAIFAAFSGLIALGVGSGSRTAGFVIFTGSLFFLLLVVLLLAIGGEVVTIQGKRTQARMEFVLRPARSAETYRRACRLVRERQERLKRQGAAGVLAAAGVRSRDSASHQADRRADESSAVGADLERAHPRRGSSDLGIRG